MTIVLINYNSWRLTDACLESLRHLDFPTFRTVVDNGSTDDSLDRLRKYWPDLDLVEITPTVGFTATGKTPTSASACAPPGGSSRQHKSEAFELNFTRSAVRFFRKHARVPPVPILAGPGFHLVKRMLRGQWGRARGVAGPRPVRRPAASRQGWWPGPQPKARLLPGSGELRSGAGRPGPARNLGGVGPFQGGGPTSPVRLPTDDAAPTPGGFSRPSP